MAVDSGTDFVTKIPSLSDSADIQEALKVFLYGSVANATAGIGTLTATDGTDGLAGHLNSREDALQATAATNTADIATNTADIAAMGVWTDYSPTWGYLTVGNGTSTGRYTKVQDTVSFEARFIVGSTSVISAGGSMAASLPFAANPARFVTVNALFENIGSNFWPGRSIFGPGSAWGSLMCYQSNATYSWLQYLTASIPFVWTTNDSIMVYGTYEAA